VRGQIEGAIVQAEGYAVLENFVVKDARPLTTLMSNYLIPTVLDVPDRVKSVLLENADPIGPYGARGMAEMPFLPFAAAVAAALKDALGVWIDEFPYTPDRMWHALRGLESKK